MSIFISGLELSIGKLQALKAFMETVNSHTEAVDDFMQRNKAIQATSSASLTSDTYFGKPVYIKTWEGNITPNAHGGFQIVNFFPQLTCRIVDFGGGSTTTNLFS
jgi:hypothetical protein